MGVSGVDVHLPAVWNTGGGTVLALGGGRGFLHRGLKGAQRPEGPTQKRAAGAALARGIRKRYRTGRAAPEPGGSGATVGSGAGIRLW
jgi:hypothetical protein